jgi:hypothetical protein
MVCIVVIPVIKVGGMAGNEEQLIDTSRKHFTAIKIFMDRRGMLRVCVRSQG